MECKERYMNIQKIFFQQLHVFFSGKKFTDEEKISLVRWLVKLFLDKNNACSFAIGYFMSKTYVLLNQTINKDGCHL